MQVKHNLEHEVENMEDEIYQLKAQLEGDSDMEERITSDEENVAENYAECEKIVTPSLKANKITDSDQIAVEQGGVAVLATPETEDWPELSANTVKILCESMMMPHDTTVDKNTSMIEDNGGKLLNAEFDSKVAAAESRATEIQGAASLVSDHSCSTSDVPVVDASEAGPVMNKHCIQSANAGVLDHETVSAVPDSLDRTASACDVADDGMEDDNNSYVSCEDIVIPDSDDELYSSPPSEDNNHTAIASHRDELKHVNISTNISHNDVLEQSDEVAGCAERVKTSDAHSSETMQHVCVDSSDGRVKQERRTNKEECSNKNERNNNTTLTERFYSCMSDRHSDDTVKHVDVVAPSGEPELTQAASPLHRRRKTSAVVCEQLPKRPYWKFVVSGISPILDQVISAIVGGWCLLIVL